MQTHATIWLLRHAKATESDRGGPRDFDRAITEVGAGRASTLGEFVRNDPIELEGIPRPEVILCSSAVRTRQTYERFARAAEIKVPVVYSRVPYDDDELAILHQIAAIGEVASVLVVGHNPTIAYLRELLLEPDERSDRLTPTSALSIVGFSVASVSAVTTGTGHLLAHIPRLEP